MGKRTRKRPRGHLSVHLLECQVWSVCRRTTKKRSMAAAKFTAVTMFNGLPDGRAVAGGIEARGFG